ncbi:MAG: hypothetical protein KC425_09590 [Anaerolineales bacterium]|nr:hypothetical protein [Anaerolineales bacterium]
MQIQIPESISSRLRRLAALRQEPVEVVLADRLFTSLDEELLALPSAEQIELRALHYLSDDALRAITAEQMPAPTQAILADLMERHSQGQLSVEEVVRLEALVERGEQLMLRKAEAAAILVSRGYADTAVDLLM